MSIRFIGKSNLPMCYILSNGEDEAMFILLNQLIGRMFGEVTIV